MRAIKRLREARGWSRRTLATKARITEQTIKNLERDDWTQRVQERVRAGLVAALGVEPQKLFFKDGRVR